MNYQYFEETLRLLLFKHKSITHFINFFDKSKQLIGFNYDDKLNVFTHVSKSFENILGYKLCNIEDKNNFFKKIIHPHDKDKVTGYFNVKNFSPSKHIDGTVRRLKFRGKHIKGYWKYFMVFSIFNVNSELGTIYISGVLVDQKNNGCLQYSCDENTTSISNSYLYRENNWRTDLSKIRITHREIEILELISNGIIAKEIADRLNISVSTVITHRKNLISKLQVRNTAELVKVSTKLMLI